MLQAVVLVLDGVFDSSLGVTLDVLRSAAKLHEIHCGGTVRVEILTCGLGSLHINTGAGLRTRLDALSDDVVAPDVVVAPGLGVSDPAEMDQVLDRKAARKAVAYLRSAHARGAIVAASCSATFLLAEADVFDDGPATTSWWLADAFRSRYPHVDLQPERLLVESESVLCAGAAMAQADLMMALVTRLYGEETARLTAHYLLIDRREFQSQYLLSRLMTGRHSDVAAAERWIREHISRDFSIAELAAGVGLSERTLARRLEKATGAGPLKFVQQLRLEHAVHLLESTSRSFEMIAMDVGYLDASSLRRLLQRQMGKTPSRYRRDAEHHR